MIHSRVSDRGAKGTTQVRSNREKENAVKKLLLGNLNPPRKILPFLEASWIA